MTAVRSEHRLYLDIDRTLVDTDQTKARYITALAIFCHVPEKTVVDSLQLYVSSLDATTDFDPLGFAEALVRELPGSYSAKQLESVILRPEHFASAVYEDVQVLRNMGEELPGLGLRMGIYSEGVKRWQELKLLAGKINDIFAADLREIHRRKLAAEALTRLSAGSVIVDDKVEVVQTLATKRPDLHPVWINRASKDKSSIAGVETIHSLRELPALLRKIWLGTQHVTE